MKSIAGKVCVVTGASSGIGERVAQALAARGAHLVLAARREDRIERLAAAIRERDGRAIAVPTDVAVKKDLEALVSAVQAEFGRCDVLVNNAGVPGGGPFEDVSLRQIDQVVAVNQVAVMRATRLFLPMLLESHGHVVNVASLAGRFAVPGASIYTATKHAVVAFSEALHHELAPRGVAVTVVNPGFIATEGFPQTELLADRRLRHLVMTPEPTVRAIVDVIARRRGPEVSVPRWMGALQAFRVLTPPLYRGLMRRIAGTRTASFDAEPD